MSFALAYLLYKVLIDKDKTAVVLDTDVLEGVSVAIQEVVPFFSGVSLQHGENMSMWMLQPAEQQILWFK